MTNIVQIKVPNTGMDSTEKMQVIEVLVSVGDIVDEKQSCITIESNKASIEIPISKSGKVKSVHTKVGDSVAEGSLILELETNAAKIPIKPNLEPISLEVNQKKMIKFSDDEKDQKDLEFTKDFQYEYPIHSSPTARKFARELGVDLKKVRGSGPRNRITVHDIRIFVKDALEKYEDKFNKGSVSDWDNSTQVNLSKIDYQEFGPVESKPLSEIRKIIGRNLHRNWVTIPHVTNNDEADITDLENLRLSLNSGNQNIGFKVTVLAFLIKAVSISLRKYPDFNSSIDGENLILKKYFNIGFAVDTPRGLLVPVIRDVHKKGVLQIAEDIKQLSEKARASKILNSELKGGCFSISSLGGIGGTSFTPIINFPEVAILGVSKAVYKPIWNPSQNKFLPRLILPLSLSYDHRVIDGAAAARFNGHLSGILSDYRLAML